MQTSVFYTLSEWMSSDLSALVKAWPLICYVLLWFCAAILNLCRENVSRNAFNPKKIILIHFTVFCHICQQLPGFNTSEAWTYRKKNTVFALAVQKPHLKKDFSVDLSQQFICSCFVFQCCTLNSRNFFSCWNRQVTKYSFTRVLDLKLHQNKTSI